MSKCGYRYKGQWRDSEAGILELIQADFQDILTESGERKQGVSMRDALNRVDIVLTNSVEKAEEETTAVDMSNFDRVIRALRKYRYKAPMVFTDGTTREIKLSSTEENGIISAMQNNYVTAFLSENRDTVDEKMQARIIYNGYWNSLSDVFNIAQEAYEYVLELQSQGLEDTHQYKETLQYQKLLAEITSNNGSNEQFEKYSKEAYESTMKALGFIVDFKAQKDDVNIEQETKIESWMNTESAISTPATDKVMARVKAKFMLYNNYELDADDNPMVSTGILGTTLRYDSNIRNATFLTVAEMLSNNIDNTVQSKIDDLTEYANLIQTNPGMFLDHYFIMDLVKDLTDSKSLGAFTEREKYQLNLVTNMDSLKMYGLDAISGKDKSQSLIVKDFSYSNAFIKAVANLKAIFNELDSSGMIQSLKDINSGTSFKSVLSTESKNKFIVKRIYDELAGKKYSTTAEELEGESTADLMFNLNKNVVLLSTINTPLGRTYNIKNQPEFVLFNDETGEISLSEEGRKVEAEILRQQTAMANVISNRLASTSAMLKLPISAASIHATKQGLILGEELKTVSFEGVEKSKVTTINVVVKNFFREVAQMAAKPGTAKPQYGIKTYLNWSVSKGSQMHNEATTRVGNWSGSKTVANLNNPRTLNRSLKKLHDSKKTQDNILQGIFSGASRILNLIKSKALPWISEVFSQPSVAGILPTFKSNVDKKDDPLTHSLYIFGTYLASINLKFKDRGQTSYGNPIEDFQDTVTNSKGDWGRTYNLKGRQAKFSTPAFSDSDTPAMIDSIDFDAFEGKPSGETVIKDEYLKYYVDSIITPEINRIKAASRGTANVRDYTGSLFYFHPELNENFEAQELIKNLTMPKEGIGSFYSTMMQSTNEDNADLVRLQNLIEAAATKSITKSSDKFLDQLTDQGMFEEVNGDLYITKDFANLEDFKSLIADKNSKEENASPEDIEAATIALKRATETLVDPTITDVINALAPLTDKSKTKLFIAQIKKLYKRKSGDKLHEVFKMLGFDISSEKLKSVQDKLGYGEDFLGDFDDETGESDSVKPTAVDENKEVLQLYQQSFKGTSLYIKQSLAKSISIVPSTVKAGLKKRKVSKDLIGAKVDMSKLTPLLMRHSFGYAFTMANFHQVTIGDPAMFYKQANTNKPRYTADNEEIPGTPTFGSKDYDYTADIQTTMTNLGKRLKKEVSPSLFAEGGKTIKYINTTSEKRDSEVYNGENGYIEVKGMDTDDAASYTTVRSAISFMILEGKISPGRQASEAYDYLAGDLSMTEDIYKDHWGKAAFSDLESGTWKPIAVGHELRKMGDGTFIRVPLYVKVAETILTEALTGTNPNNPLARRRLMMEQLEEEENSINGFINYDLQNWVAVKSVPPSGLKVGNVSSPLSVNDMPYDAETGKFTIDPGHIVTTTTNDYGRQGDTLWHEGKQVKPSGQAENLLFNNTTAKTKVTILEDGKEVEVNLWSAWDEAQTKSYDKGFEDLMKAFDPSTAPSALIAILGNDSIQKNTEDEDIPETIAKGDVRSADQIVSDFLGKAIVNQNDAAASKTNKAISDWLIVEDGTFKYNLTEAPHFDKYVDVLRKAYEKKTVTRKRSGTSLALIPDLGIDVNDSTTGITYIKGVQKLKSGRLSPPTETTGAQVLLSWDVEFTNKRTGQNVVAKMEDFLTNDGREIDPKKLPEELLQRFGFRTPTQDYSMTSNIQVIGFLPRGYRNGVIAPAEFTATMGSDFDIDKLVMYKQNLIQSYDTDSGGKKLSTITKEDVESSPKLEKAYWDNRKQALLQGILNDSKILKEEVVANLDGEDSFKKNVDGRGSFTTQVQTARGEAEVEDNSILFPSYQATKRNNATEASSAIGVFAKLARTWAQYSRVKPPLYVTGANGTEEIATLSLGDKRIKNLGSNKSIFTRDKDLEDPAFNKIKNNISALISLAVDDEKLQMLYKLNINGKTYDDLQALIMVGLRAKTSIALASAMQELPTYNMLAKAYNKSKSKREGIERVFREAEKEDGGELIFGSDINTIDESTTETTFTSDVLDLTKKVREEGVASLTGDELINAMGLVEFVGTSKKVYKHSVAPFQFAINLDSKGFTYDMGAASAQINSTRDEGNKKIWDTLNGEEYTDDNGDTKYKGGIVEMRLGVKSMSLYVDKLKDIFSKEAGIMDIYSYLEDNGIVVPSIFDVAKMFRAKKYQEFAPDIKSLVSRLRIILNDPRANEYKLSNLFLSRLHIMDGNSLGKGKRLVFHKDMRVEEEDIVRSLEELKNAGEIAGVDMRLLYDDLINYGITESAWGYGDNYNQYILPENYVMGKSASKNIDYLALAVHVAANNMQAVIEGPTDKLTIWKEKGEDGYEIHFIGHDGLAKVYTYADSMAFEARDFDASKTLLTEVPGGEPTVDGDIPINDSMAFERLLNYHGFSNARLLFQAALPKGTRLFKSPGSSWEGKTNKMRLKPHTNISQLRADITHETIHAVLSRAIFAYTNGTLQKDFPGVTDGNEQTAQELERVLQTLEEGMRTLATDVRSKTAENLQSSLGNSFSMQNPIEAQFVLAGLNNNLAMSGFNRGREFINLLDAEDMKAIYPEMSEEEIAGVTDSLYQFQTGDVQTGEEKALILYGFNKALTNGSLKLKNVNSTNGVLEYTRQDGEVFYGARLDRATYKNLTGTVTDSFEALKGEIGEMADTNVTLQSFLLQVGNLGPQSESTDAYKYKSYYELLYGLQDLQEFSASTHKYGNDSFSDRISYASISKYESALDATSEYTIFSSELLNKMFNMLRKVIRAILGRSNENNLWADTTYATGIAHIEKVVNVELVKGIKYTNLAENILKKC